jgi:hypothetical protein
MALIDNIYAYYKLDEASGASAIDATGNARTLSNFGPAIGSAAGKINTSRDFTGTGGTTLIRNANTTDFFVGANPFFFNFWVRFRTFPGFNDVGLCNRYEPFGQREYIMFLRQSDQRIVFLLDNGAGSTAVQWGSVAALNTWYMVSGGWDGTLMKMSINGGNFVTTPFAGPTVNGGDNFKLGYEAASLDGQMDEFGFWMGKCLSLTEVTQLYNGGNGLAFSQFGTVTPPPNVFNSDGTSTGGPNSIQTLHDATACHDGDTITIPAGTFTWTTGISITKAITLQGQTTIVGDHTTYGLTGVRPTVNDATIIRDNVTAVGSPPRSPALMAITNNTATGTFRLTGVTLTSVVRIVDTSFMINIAGTSGKIRVDHVHSTACNRPWTWGVFTANGGVFDHFLCDPIGGTQEFDFRNRAGANGDEEYAELGSAFYGTDRFWYIEDSYIDNNVSAVNTAGGSDRENAGRVIWRYNFLHNAEIVTHGTYSGRRRGGRAGEECFNVMKWDAVKTADGSTSGSYMVHDNILVGSKLQGWSLRNYRTFSNTDPNWGGAGGNNPWDINATRSDGTHHDGEPPFSFYGPDTVIDSTIVQGPGPTGGNMTLTVNGTPWVPNQWIGYTACRSPNTPDAHSYVGEIRANTNNQLTMYWYPEAAAGFPIGSVFNIYKLIQGLDQPGTGKGDLVSPLTPPTPPTGFAGVHQQLEPCYSWNNVFQADGTLVNFTVPSDSTATVLQNVHFFNNTAQPGHVDYTYPHPLVTGAAPPVTKIISLSGIPSLAFGNVTIGAQPPTAVLRVSNSGTALLTVTGTTYPSGFSGFAGGFTVPSGSFFDVTVAFTPLLPQLYSGNIVVASDATSGTGSIAASGTGVNPVVPGQEHRKYVSDAFGF